MTNILKENFEKYLKARYGSTIDALSRTFSKFGIDYFLIGALSRNLWVQHLEGLPPIRMTTDKDFAVLVNDKDQYHDIMQHLIDLENFVEDPEPYKHGSDNFGKYFFIQIPIPWKGRHLCPSMGKEWQSHLFPEV